jgi:hypothetical protein
MPSDGEPSKNPFVRFKQHVDAHISAGLNSVLPSKSNSQQPEAMAPQNSRSTEADQDFQVWLASQRHAVAAEELHDSALTMDVIHVANRRGFSQEGKEKGLHHLRFQRWAGFLIQSRYSPLMLATQPWNPRPRGMDPDMDSSLFTWVDAFEDLLAESSGMPMMDLRTRYNLNRVNRQKWPEFGGLLTLDSWLQRLNSRGLPLLERDVFFGTTKLMESKPTYAIGRPELPNGQRDDNAADQELGKPRGSGAEQEQQTGSDGTFFGELDKILKVLNKVLDDNLTPQDSRRRTEHDNNTTREPETETDLYNAIQTAFNEARSLSTFLKTLSEGGFASPVTKAITNDAVTKTHDDVSDKTEVSKEEFVDDYGNLHTKTITQRTSADGTRTMREETYSVRPAPRDKKPDSQDSKPVDTTITNDGDDGSKGAGWFWKKD